MDFYKVLQELLEKKNLSIPEMSRVTGIPDSTIRSIINRKSKTVSLEIAFKISHALNVSLEELSGENVDMAYSDVGSNTNENKNTPNEDEQKLVTDFRKLNAIGQQKALSDVNDLTQINKYTIDNEEANDNKVKGIMDNPKRVNLKEELAKLDPIETVAAHNDHWDEPGEMEKMMRDIERIKQLKKGEK